MKYAAGRRRCVLRVLLGPRTAVCGLPVCHCLHTAQLGLGRSCLRPARARVSRTMDCHRLYCNTVYQAYLLPVFFFFQAYGLPSVRFNAPDRADGATRSLDPRSSTLSLRR